MRMLVPTRPAPPSSRMPHVSGVVGRELLSSAVRSIWSNALAGLLPSLCSACGTSRRGIGGGGVCSACWASLPLLQPDDACPSCALPSPGGSPCPACATTAPPVTVTRALGLYRGPLREIVLAYKFRGHDLLAAPVAARLAGLAREAGLATGPRTVVPIPSTPRRNRSRGYDPSDLLAAETARRLHLPLVRLLSRTRETAPQSSLPAASRPLNVAGAFRARPHPGPLLLVDDVLTTGATAFEAARALLSAGAPRVDLLVLARTPEPEDFRAPETP